MENKNNTVVDEVRYKVFQILRVCGIIGILLIAISYGFKG